jgi:hypothetical protein
MKTLKAIVWAALITTGMNSQCDRLQKDLLNPGEASKRVSWIEIRTTDTPATSATSQSL